MNVEELRQTSTEMSSPLAAMVSKAEIDQQIATARKYPRSIREFLDECRQMVTLNDRVAAECIYSLPRSGKMIEGPSARFAEVLASAWRNCRAGARVVNEDKHFITAQGIFHDLERNVAITYEVRRRITNKSGTRYNEDMIAVTGNAASSIALRNAVLKGIPKAFWADLYDEARKTAMGDAKTLASRRADALQFLARFGATEQMVCNTLKVRGPEDITLEHLAQLRGMATAIKDGDGSVETLFGEPDKPSGKTVADLRAAAGNGQPGPIWPKEIIDDKTGLIDWVDSTGAKFDKHLHAMTGDTPTVTKDGVFRRRRGAKHVSESATNEPGTRTESFLKVTYPEAMHAIEHASTPEDLKAAQLAVDNFDGPDNQRDELVARLNAVTESIGSASANAAVQ